ncbi:MAG: tRNA pseudouridine synthase A [Phycisphaerales bacterium]
MAQPTGELRSVQGVVERAVREAVRQPVTLMGASRTDSGVHAKHQTAAFTMVEQFTNDGRRIGPPDDRLQEAINSRLPSDVLVTRCVRAADDFDPIGGCLCKGYEYTIWESRDRPLWERGRVWHQRGPLHVPAMDEAARLIEGTHDFASFAAAGHGRESTVRTVLSCRVERDASDAQRVVIRVSADGFLWNMVRIIAGTLLEVGRGKTVSAALPEIIAARDRTRSGPTAPAHGLCLAWGMYEGDEVPHEKGAPAIDAAWLAERAAFIRQRRAERLARREAERGTEGGVIEMHGEGSA